MPRRSPPPSPSPPPPSPSSLSPPPPSPPPPSPPSLSPPSLSPPSLSPSPSPAPSPPFGRKPGFRPEIFSVRVVSPSIGSTSGGEVRIFSVLQARSRGVAAVAELAAAQRALVHRRQLLAAGLTRARIQTLVAHGTLHPVLGGVFAVGTPELAPLAAETAVLLQLAHDAVISHQSAAALWGLAPARDRVQATIIGRGLRPRDGLELHRVARLDSNDVRLRHGLPVTGPARTVIDLAAHASAATLAEVAGEARARGLLDPDELEAALGRAPLRTGTAAVRRLRRSTEGGALTRSRFERTLLRLLTRADLPLPLTNQFVNGVEVDAWWPDQRLILECDSWTHHSGRAAFERDRARDQIHLAHGDRVIRVTWRQLTGDPLRTVARIARALAATPARA